MERQAKKHMNIGVLSDGGKCSQRHNQMAYTGVTRPEALGVVVSNVASQGGDPGDKTQMAKNKNKTEKTLQTRCYKSMAQLLGTGRKPRWLEQDVVSYISPIHA